MNEPDDILQEPFPLMMENEMIALYQSIDGLLPDTPKKIIPFMGCRHQEGNSTILQEFAIVSAMKFHQTVLLLDGSMAEYSQHLLFDMETLLTIEDVVIDGNRSVYEAFSQVEDSDLYLGKIFSGPEPNPSFLSRAGIDDLLEKLRGKFDLILIDAPPSFSLFSSNLSVSKLIDGIVLTVEAEKTRWPVVKSFISRVKKNDGKILGIVLNKRRYHIPGCIYNRL